MKPGQVLRKGLGVITILALAGCGFKGPLILPEQAAENQAQEQQKEPEPQTSPHNEEK